MRSLADVQAEFAAALRDPHSGTPEAAVGPDGTPSARRFAAYRNNVIAGLVDAVTGSFPAIQRIVGEEFFRAMARSYVLAHPPGSPVLIEYGATFADFIAAFEPAAGLPYLADVARIERAWREAYHAAEATPLDGAALASLMPEELPLTVLILHPSMRIVRSMYPAFTIWRMNVTDAEIVPVDMAAAEDTLIVRPHAEVEARTLPGGGAVFLAALAAGTPLGEAAASGLAADAGFNLAGNIAGLIAAGVLVGIGR